MIERNAHGRDFKKTRFFVLAKRLAVVLPVAISIMAGVQVHAQILHATGPLPSFEVATIKPGKPGATGIRAFGPKGADRFLAMNVTVKDLIDFAYTIDDDRQVVGLSGWMISKRYDIDAKVGDAEVAAMSNCLCPITHTDSCNRPYLLIDSASKFTLKRGCYRSTRWWSPRVVRSSRQA
jgi:hypothetical protein